MRFNDFFSAIDSHLETLSPSSPNKLMLLAEYCGVRDGSRILDLGSGKGHLLRVWAKRWEIEGVGVDINPASVAAAREGAAAEGVARHLTFVRGAARDFAADAPFDVVTCTAPFVIGSYQEAAAWMSARTKKGGALALGDEYLPAPLPEHVDANVGDYRTLEELNATLEGEGLFLTGMIAASQDDWDRYASGGWRACYDWLRDNPHHPDRDEVARCIKQGLKTHLMFVRQYLGWALLVARKP